MDRLNMLSNVYLKTYSFFDTFPSINYPLVKMLKLLMREGKESVDKIKLKIQNEIDIK